MIIGIDLGTTNSLVAVYRDKKVTVIPNALGQYMTPSAVGIDDKGQIIVGQLARERLNTHPDETIASFKRYMGTDRLINLGSKLFRAEELSALLLGCLKQDAEKFLGHSIIEAIVTVPAYFNNSQRKATKVAAELAGLKVDRLLNEPTAAALAYGLHKKNEQRYLIFDLGGGTFDVSIVEYFEGVLEVHASAGDNYLGGNDFTKLISAWMLIKIREQLGMSVNEKPDKKLIEIIRDKADEAKHKLSKHNSTEIKFNWEEKPITLSFSEGEFAEICESLLDRIRNPIHRTLRDSNLELSDLDEIILVGGSSRMPLVRQLVTRLFQRFPNVEVDPDKVVVVGAAIQAALKQKHSDLKDTVLTDVCPYTLGIEVSEGSLDNLQEGYYLPIIERNASIPNSIVKRVYSINNNQTQIEVKIFQGESMLVKDNIFLGNLMANIPKGEAGEEAIDVRFSYDVNGLLEIDVEVVTTRTKYVTTIEQNPGVLTEQEIAESIRKLQDLKIHPRDDECNQVLIFRAERIYQESLGEVREVITNVISEFLTILDRQDKQDIKHAREQFQQFLQQFEV